MMIDWAHFTPWTALIGGLLRPVRGDVAWRLLFLAGIVLVPFAWSLFATLPEVRIDAGATTLLLAGLLVGIGTRYGAGCTSGHGVCGVARLASSRSGCCATPSPEAPKPEEPTMQLLIAFGSGLVFGLGLLLSGLMNPAKVLAFLDLAGAWDPSLLCTMGGATLVAALAFRIAKRRGRTLFGQALRLPSSSDIDRRVVLGSATFGIGWGLAGFCPGPAIASLATGSSKPLLFVLAMVAGMGVFELAEWLRRRLHRRLHQRESA